MIAGIAYASSFTIVSHNQCDISDINLALVYSGRFQNTSMSPKSAYKEAISNALDQMQKDNARVEIYTDVPPGGDIVIEDWGTGIEDYNRFKINAIGEKIVDGKISSYDIVDEDIIGQKGLGKLSFLNLSSIRTVEFYSYSKIVGLKIIMTDELDGFTPLMSFAHIKNLYILIA